VLHNNYNEATSKHQGERERARDGEPVAFVIDDDLEDISETVYELAWCPSYMVKIKRVAFAFTFQEPLLQHLRAISQPLLSITFLVRALQDSL